MNLKRPRKKIYQILDSASHMKSVLNAVNEGDITFNQKLQFSNTGIYTAGLNYSIDTRTAFQGYLTNGFGLSPATAILTIPTLLDLLIICGRLKIPFFS